MASQDELFAELFGGGSGSDVSDIGNFQKAVAANNIFSQLAPQVASAPFNTSNWSLGQTVGITAGKAFLSSLLNAIGQRQQSDQLNSLASVLPQLYEDPLAVSAPEGVDPQAFAGLKLATLARKDNSGHAGLQEIAKSLFGVKIAGMEADAKTQAELEARRKFYGAGIEDPESPQAKEADAARQEIAKLPAVTKLNTTSAALAQLKNIKDLNTASSDIPFATIFIGGLDGSVVREGEYARVAGANPFLDKYRNALEGALNGTSVLGVDIKKQMYQELVQTQKGLFDASVEQSAPRLATAIARGVKNPKTVLPFDPDMTFELPNIPTFDIGAAKADAAKLKAQGYSSADVATALRSKYGGAPRG